MSFFQTCAYVLTPEYLLLKIEHQSRKWQRQWFSSFLLVYSLSLVVLLRDGKASFIGQFSLSAGEEYNDNIFFSEKKDHDFVTFVTPTFSLVYTPVSGDTPIFTANISPSGQLFLRHGELSNFGENILASAAYTYLYSPRFTLQFSDALRRVGKSRTATSGDQGIGQGPPPPTVPTPPRGTGPTPIPHRLEDLISKGALLTNQIAARGAFQYLPNIRFLFGYAMDYMGFLDQGGNETSHSANVRGVYNWREEHNLHAGYTVRSINFRSGEGSIVHDFDIGDDYFTTHKIQLTPTLTVSASTGISLNTGSTGPRVTNNSNLSLVKIWEAASLTAGVRKGLTGSLGVSGLSDTTTFFTGFNVRLTEYLTANAGVDYSQFNTKDVDFNIFQANMGFQYPITSWLSSNLKYEHRFRDSGNGAAKTTLQSGTRINSNSVSLLFTAQFDIWPNVGLGTGPILSPQTSYGAPSTTP